MNSPNSKQQSNMEVSWKVLFIHFCFLDLARVEEKMSEEPIGQDLEILMCQNIQLMVERLNFKNRL